MDRAIRGVLCLIGIGVVVACSGCSRVDKRKADELVGRVYRAGNVEEETEALQEMMRWVHDEGVHLGITAFDPRTGQTLDVNSVDIPPSDIVFRVRVGSYHYRLYLQSTMNIAELMLE